MLENLLNNDERQEKQNKDDKPKTESHNVKIELNRKRMSQGS